MKLKVLFMALLTVLVLTGCTLEPSGNNGDPTPAPNDDPTPTTEIKNEKTLAYTTYLAANFLASEEITDENTSRSDLRFLQTEDETLLEIEKELGEVSGYFRRLKVFLDHGLDEPFTIETGLDVNEDYAFEMRYTVEDKTYTILFNEDEAGTLEGVLIMNGNEYALEGTREAENETDDGEEESEEEIFLRTTDTDTENYVEIEIEAEQESDEFEFSMTLLMVIGGNEKELSMEFESEDDETSIELETSEGNEYEFSRETEDGIVEYLFEYTVNDVDGEVELTITKNDNGEDLYRYHIEEDGEEKDIDETDDDDDDDDEDDEDDDDDDL